MKGLIILAYHVQSDAGNFICRGGLNPVTSSGRTSVDISVCANLELADKFCYLSDMLSVECGGWR